MNSPEDRGVLAETKNPFPMENTNQPTMSNMTANHQQRQNQFRISSKRMWHRPKWRLGESPVDTFS